jgi:pimeloyl-ACP methyl ester carboxylesterase
VLLLLADGSQLSVTELPGHGPWTFLVVQPEHLGPDPGAAGPDQGAAGLDPGSMGPQPGGVARGLTRFGRAVVPDLRGRPGWGRPPGGPEFLDLVDDLDRVRTRAGLGRPVLVGLGELAPVALRAAATATELARLDLPALVLDADPGSVPGTAALERLLDRLGGGPGWAGIAPDAPPR